MVNEYKLGYVWVLINKNVSVREPLSNAGASRIRDVKISTNQARPSAMNEVVSLAAERGNANHVSLWNDAVKLKKDRKKEKTVCVFITMFFMRGLYFSLDLSDGIKPAGTENHS